jgi:hypothetical protein
VLAYLIVADETELIQFADVLVTSIRQLATSFNVAPLILTACPPVLFQPETIVQFSNEIAPAFDTIAPAEYKKQL